MMDLISVIVPVYKVEAYLDRCVQSIVNQTYRNLEIILVDDGSPDNCPAMCDAWAERDSRIKVIHKENGGGAQARNVGLDRAAGQYIGFVDSDDYIHPEMYQYLHQMICETGSDIAECGYYLTERENSWLEEITDEIRRFNTEEALRENIRDHVCRQLLWNKLYRRETIGDIRMAEGKTIDDEFFTYQALAKAKVVTVGGRKMYAYRQQANSIMHQKYSVKWIAAVEAKLQRYLFVREYFPNLSQEAGTNLQYTCIYHGQLSLKYLAGAQKKQVLKWLGETYASVPLKTISLPFVQKCWLRLAKQNFALCCWMRNKLRIGL